MWLLHIGNLVADESIFIPFVGIARVSIKDTTNLGVGKRGYRQPSNFREQKKAFSYDLCTH